MTYLYNTGNQPCAMELTLQSAGARNIFVTGYDTQNNDPYFRRICELERGKRHTFYFGMPISPQQLKVQIFDQDNRLFSQARTFQLGEPRIVQLRTSTVAMNQQDADFLKFAECMSVDMPSLQPGKDYVLDGKFKIQLFEDLDTSTPARIHSQHDYIQVSKVDFLKMTIPRRIVILLHEYAHNFINEDKENESEADLHALSI